MFALEVRSGAEKLLPVVTAPCVCAVLVVCVPAEDESLAAIPSAALREAHGSRTLKRDNNRPESKAPM